MFYLTKIITAILLPPFNLAVIWLGSLLCYRLNHKKTARILSFLGIGLLYLLSTPYLATKLSDSLVKNDNLSLKEYQSAQAIVVLGGGVRDSQEIYGKTTVGTYALERMRYAAYLQKETGLPMLITGSSPNGTSEAALMAKEFEYFFNVPTTWQEHQAKTTKENANFSRPILEQAGIHKIILVTNQWHMQRAKMLFEKQGFEVLPASIGHGVTPPEYIGWTYFIPQSGAMDSSMVALKEWLGYWKEK